MRINNEVKVGMVVVICLVALGVLTFKVGDFSFHQEGYEVNVEFRNIDGIETNAPVRLNGLEVGKVTDLEIVYDKETKIVLTLWIDQSAKVREGTKASVKTMGLMGEKYIALTDENISEEFLQPGVTIVGKEPIDIDALMAKGDVIADNVQAITQNIKERLEINKESIDEIIENFKYVSENFEILSDDLKRNPWKLLFRTKEKKKEE
ncbi:MlaD family protein [Candidatus Omnitrophota bacterium]